MNKYEKWYQAITARGQTRVLNEYTETHHIQPVSLGGADTPENLTRLTAREHFICHWLLTKITTGEARHKMLNALRMMRAENPQQQRYKTKITARVYAKLKTEYSQLQSERYSGEGNPMYGDKFYRSEEGKQRQSIAISGENNGAKQEEARAKISASKLGKKRAPFSAEWREKMSEAHKGENNNRYGVPVSDETRKKISDKLRGRKQSPETVAKRSAAARGATREKKQCPHCEQMIAVNAYPRWHGDNCRSKC
jgi:hypothetical protein